MTEKQQALNNDIMTATKTAPGYNLIRGCWFRTDRQGFTIRVLERLDFTPDQMPTRKPCRLCGKVPHSEMLHEEFLWNDEHTGDNQ